MSDFRSALVSAFGSDRVREHVPLAEYTTFHVGGPADWLLETRTSGEIVTALRLAHDAGVPVTLLGGGSNVLISDEGIRGLVIRTRGGEVRRIDDRHIRADAAVSISGLVRWTIVHGAAGLEAWAGTPGTVGGAIFGNAHFGGQLIGSLVTSATLASRAGVIRMVDVSDMAFGYDRSRLQESGEVLLTADFRVQPGDPATLRAIARRSLAYRKETQPLAMASAGCIFQNPDPARDRVPADTPCSAGALIDRAGLKSARIGGALVSSAHANFIVNEGGATAEDIRRLIERCRAAVRDQFGVELREEIVYLGPFATRS